MTQVVWSDTTTPMCRTGFNDVAPSGAQAHLQVIGSPAKQHRKGFPVKILRRSSSNHEEQQKLYTTVIEYMCVCVCVCSEYRTPLACYGKRCIYTKIVVSTRGNHICLLTDLGPARILRWIHFPVCVSWQLIINGELLDSPLVVRPLLGRCYHLILNLVAGSVMIATRTLVYSLDCLLAL